MFRKKVATLKKNTIVFFFLHLCLFLQGKVPKL